MCPYRMGRRHFKSILRGKDVKKTQTSKFPEIAFCSWDFTLKSSRTKKLRCDQIANQFKFVTPFFFCFCSCMCVCVRVCVCACVCVCVCPISHPRASLHPFPYLQGPRDGDQGQGG